MSFLQWNRLNQMILRSKNRTSKQKKITDRDNLHEEALTWEASHVVLVERSERRAWFIALASIIANVLLILAIVCMMPLKENTPYVIRVDNTTGIPDILTAMDKKDVHFDEIMDKYWLAQYVQAHETYDWYTLQKDYDTVGFLSSKQVGQEYAAIFDGKDALDKKYGKSIRVSTEIISIVPNGKGIGTVRFIKKVKSTDESNTPRAAVTKWIATIAYEYKKPSIIRESIRLTNPFGFQVLSYRVDPEMGIIQ